MTTKNTQMGFNKNQYNKDYYKKNKEQKKLAQEQFDLETLQLTMGRLLIEFIWRLIYVRKWVDENGDLLPQYENDIKLYK